MAWLTDVDATAPSGSLIGGDRRGIFGAWATATFHLSSEDMSFSSCASIHSAWLPESMGDRRGDKLKHGLSVRLVVRLVGGGGVLRPSCDI